jgi:MFS family permease
MAGVVTAASAAASSIGSVVLGRTGDRIGYRRVLIVSALAASGLYFLQATAANIPQLILLQVGVGVALAGGIASLTALLARFAPQGQHGAVFGVSTSVMAASNAVAPMLGAAVAVALGNRATFLLAAIGFILAAAFVGLLLPDRQPDFDVALETVSARKGRQARPVKTP